jgi:gas vesicle protein
MQRGKKRPEVVLVERGGDTSAKWLFWGALLGAGLALLYAPRSGEETRRSLQRRLWKLRALTEEKLDELSEKLSSGVQEVGSALGRGPREEDEDDEFEDLDDLPPPAARTASAREEFERRLSTARSRRRRSEPKEPPA